MTKALGQGWRVGMARAGSPSASQQVRVESRHFQQVIFSSHGQNIHVTAQDSRSCIRTILSRPTMSVQATDGVQAVAEQGLKVFETRNDRFLNHARGRRIIAPPRGARALCADNAQAGPSFHAVNHNRQQI
jgi:hypothetical protein